ncbi:hypothetical protein [uncultured Paludibaculum sp.]|uniref:hypothetical protein n=1 Tax=uncultured Paludibaculum sp. TaxID=1765020 RepID=UPI002AAAD998|nr:hypothetical protein [uncultured Paludibaculum sp.]
MMRFAMTMVLAAGFAGAQTEAPASQWKDVAKQIGGDAALIRVAARSVASLQGGLAEDLGLLREQIEGQQLRAAHIQTKLYEIERAQCAAGLYQDSKLDQLKETADRLSDLTAIQRASLRVPDGKPEWKVLKRQAKSTEQVAQRIEKDIEAFAD